MPNRIVLEICVESVDHAVAAECGGANRVELCSDMSIGGITPSAGLMRVARKHVRIPIFALVRPRRGNFFYSRIEFETMVADIEAAKKMGMDGIVLGLLNPRSEVDIPRTRELVELARPLPVTFHHAFDAAPHLQRALEAVMKTGAKRILTSGGKPRAADNLAGLAKLVERAGEQILIMPGGGISARNVARISNQTLAREIHTSLGTSLESSNGGNRRLPGEDKANGLKSFERRVKELAKLLGAEGRS